MAKKARSTKTGTKQEASVQAGSDAIAEIDETGNVPLASADAGDTDGTESPDTAQDPADAEAVADADEDVTADEIREESTGAAAPSAGAKANNGVSWATVFASVIASALVAILVLVFGPESGLIPNRNADALASLSDEISTLTSENLKLTTEIDVLKTELQSKETVGTAASLAADLSAFDVSLTNSIGEFDRRLTDLENRPIPDIGATEDAVAAYEKQLASMREMLAAELDTIRAQQANVVQSQEMAIKRVTNAEVQRALGQIENALTTGAPFADALAMLSSHDVPVPETLTQASGQGVPTTSALLEEFGEAARHAIAAEGVDPSESATSGLFAYLRSQVKTRSLSPQEGDSVDAVLSRAEHALRNGDLTAAASELSAIEGAPAAALADLRARIDDRSAVLEAFQTLSGEAGE